MSERSGVYEHDPRAVGDDAFEAGRLGHLVAQNRGRMLDPRRTPVTVAGVDPPRGSFEVVVGAFEDAGARWHLPLEDVSHFQFEPGATLLPAGEVEALERVVAGFDRVLEVPASEQARTRTLRDVADERVRLRGMLAGDRALRSIDLDACVQSRRGPEVAAAVFARLLDDAGLAALERAVAETYVSNPRSGEVIKGHAIVIAEMGLCPYTGKVVRDERLFEGEASKARRRAHIVLRLAFVQELAALIGRESLELYRGAAIDGVLKPRHSSLVAATFSRDVATAHFDNEADVAMLVRQRVSASRLFMSFLETAAMNDRYLEAEAVLIGEPGNIAFQPAQLATVTSVPIGV